jgi:hypothetical protein
MARELILWAIALGAPAIWLASLEAGFALAPLACTKQSNAILLLVSVLSLALVAGCGLIAWNDWQRARVRADSSPSSAPVRAMSGIILSAGFFLVIAAQTIPNLMLAGCQ